MRYPGFGVQVADSYHGVFVVVAGFRFCLLASSVSSDTSCRYKQRQVAIVQLAHDLNETQPMPRPMNFEIKSTTKRNKEFLVLFREEKGSHFVVVSDA